MAKLWKLSIIFAVVGIYFYYKRDTFDPAVLQGKNVLVTGSSKGIGRVLAIEYARLGANVMLTARNEAGLKKVLSECKSVGRKGAKFGYVVADMAEYKKTAKKVIDESVRTLGSLDQMILNHALLPSYKTFYFTGTEQDLHFLDDTMAINFRSFVDLAVHAMPYLEKTEGQLGVVSSIAGKIESAGMASYSGSKFALDGFFSTLRYEAKLQGKPISITLHNLGIIGTEDYETKLQNVHKALNLDEKKMAAIMPAPADVTETALEIIAATTRGDRELYYPSFYGLPSSLSPIIRHTFPELLFFDLNKLKRDEAK